MAALQQLLRGRIYGADGSPLQFNLALNATAVRQGDSSAHLLAFTERGEVVWIDQGDISGSATATSSSSGVADVGDILSANSILSVSQPDLAAGDVTLTVNQANIDHDALTNFVADEHVAHSGVTLTAGVGLSGGGDISASRTFDLDITELAEDTNPDEAADFWVMYDTSALAHKKVKPSNLDHNGLFNYDANRHIDHTAVTLTAGVGLSGGGTIAASRTFDLDITELTEDSSPDEAADFLVTYDTSAGTHKKVKPDNIQPKVTSATGTLPIANGGTGQTAAVAAFDALSPLTTRGDIIYRDASNNVRLQKGTTGQVLTMNANDPQWSTIPLITDTIVTLGTDFNTASTGLVDVTGMSFAMAASTMYYFKMTLFVTSTATAEGHRFAINAANAPTFLSAYWWGTTAGGTAFLVTQHTARDTAGVATSTGFVNFGVEYFEGVYSNAGASDTFQLRLRTETGGANSTTLEAGSFIQYRVIT